MKNVHILPTDKTSKLLYNHTLKSFCFQKKENEMFVNDGKVSGASFWSIEKAQHNGFCPQHIYITNSEEIKEGDWFVDTIGSEILKADSIPLPYSCKKIILTTDQDLIKDGVQPISNDFLQWFVKNPSCEEVEIDKVDIEQPKPLYPNGDHKGVRIWLESYKIIIPKEEHNQIKCYCGHTTMCDCSPIDEAFGIIYVLETLLDFAGEDNATSISISTTDAEKIIKLLKQII